MEKLHVQAEALEQKRSKWLIINLIGFCLWNGLRIIDNYLLSETLPILTGFMLLGWLIWGIGLIQIIRFGKEMKRNKQLTQILNDELTELNRLKAWRSSFIVVVLTQVAIMLTTSLIFEMSGILAAEVSIFVSVTAAISSFLYFNKETHA